MTAEVWPPRLAEGQAHMHSTPPDYEAAEKILCEVVQVYPNDPRAFISLGWCLRQVKKYRVAADYLQKGIALNPHYAKADAMMMLAEVYECQGKIKDAKKLWNEVKVMEPSYPSDNFPMEEAEKNLVKYQS